MGWKSQSLGQRYYNWALLRCCGYLLFVLGVGIPNRRSGNDPTVNVATKSRVEQLLGHGLLFRISAYRVLLPADLLPGSEGCDANA